MRLDKFTLRAQEGIQAAIELAESNQNQQVEPEHLLTAMLEQPEGIVRPILGRVSVSLQVVANDLQAAISRFPRVKDGQQYFSPRLSQVFAASQIWANSMHDDFIATEHLLLAVAEKEGKSGTILRQHGVNREDLLKVIAETRGTSRISDQNAEANRTCRVIGYCERHGNFDGSSCRVCDFERAGPVAPAKEVESAIRWRL